MDPVSADSYPKRKSPRLKGYDYSWNVYHVIIVTRNRQRIFGRVKNGSVILSEEGRNAEKALLQIPDYYPLVTVEEYAIMPDHIHFLITLYGDPEDPVQHDLRKVISAYKSQVSRQCGQPVWQRSFYDHIIRNDQDYLDTIYYIRNNPAEWEKKHNNDL